MPNVLGLPTNRNFKYSREYCEKHAIGTTPIYNKDGSEQSRWVYHKDDEGIETKIRVIFTWSNRTGLIELFKSGRNAR